MIVQDFKTLILSSLLIVFIIISSLRLLTRLIQSLNLTFNMLIELFFQLINCIQHAFIKELNTLWKFKKLFGRLFGLNYNLSLFMQI